MVARLAKLDSCAVSDALDRRQHHGVALGISRLSTDRRIAGRVVTVKLGPADGRTTTRHLCTAAVEAAMPGDIVVIDHGGRVEVAGWGGVLSAAAAQRMLGGVIIDGACRDIDESRELELPVYGRCAVAITARGRIIEYDWDVPVEISGVTVAPGDLVIADGSGVVFIPASAAEAVIADAEAIVAKERLMVADVHAGTAVSAVMGTNYERMLEGEED
ncbi:RraA family protein [Sphingomonas sp. MG17]|uniref:Putative 4-hydroxy-4-methyl-2-oxoglutarate aldolase n=1 Tax=Sphingomonas tagetis TaxID=2949092 RepID=A0A9X2HMH7_9SPHN|nr:RraA family protein [Sphingomonas tagetis]MCP3730038.1 RraA family protein [Sphingomonas tagetis]